MQTKQTRDQRRDIVELVAELEHQLAVVPRLVTPRTSDQELNRIGKALDYIHRKLPEILDGP